MVLTKKFSEFASSGLPDVGDIEVGLKGGLNTQFTQEWVFYAPGTTAQRPVSPTTGILRWNTTLGMYELWNGSAWVQFEDTTSLLALLASHTVNEGASLIGLQNQSGVTSKTVQDLANGAFIVKTNNGSMQNAQALGDLSTGILKSTTSTGLLSISAALTQIDALSPVQGDIMYHNGSAWVLLAPSTPGFILQTQGAGANPRWVFDVGTGTVESLSAATGITLTPDPITTTGTIGLTIPVLPAWGGTGLISPTAHGIMVGEGASAMTPIVLTSGQLLIGSTGVDPVAASLTAGSGVTITPGAGTITISATGSGGTVTSVATNNGLTGGTITTTGTLGLAAIADKTLLANISGGALFPSSTTLTALIDSALGSTQGNILYRNATVWTVLAPGTSGQVLTTGGAAADPSWTTNGAGTVTSVATGAGLTGGTITTSGTIALAAIADHTLLANISGGSLAPSSTTLTALIDNAIGSTQGDILYRNSTVWTVLAPGTSGQFLQTQGAAANPIWAPGDGAGTVTSIATNNGITGGTITSSGTIGLASIADHTLLANISGGSTFPSSTTLTALIDNAIGSTQGNILYRNSTAWVVLAPGTSGQVLQTGGAAANPSWVTPASGGFTQVIQTLVTSTQAFTPNASTKYIGYKLVGGGGGGGGASASATGASAGEGGSAGGGVEGIVTRATWVGAGTAATITLGAAGAAGSAGANNGGTGGTSSIVANSGAGATLAQATGGVGGQGDTNHAANNANVTNPAPGVGTLGTLNLTGGYGVGGYSLTTVAQGGQGGDSPFGFGFGGPQNNNGAGTDGNGFGSGGGGAAAITNTNRAGGAGKIAVCLVTEYI